jgi:hypothetical protein
MEMGLFTLFEDYFFKTNPKSPVHYDTFISLFIKLAKGPFDEKIKFVVSLLKQSSSNGDLTLNNLLEVSVFFCYYEILWVDIHEFEYFFL